MADISTPPLRTVLRIQFSKDQRLGRGKVELLEHIKATGSISAAGRAMDMSYRRAWLLVEEMNTMFDQAVVASQRGGSRGGGADVTPFGEAVVARFRTMEEKTAAAIRVDLDWLEEHRSADITEA
ncbi:molybdate transport system regulatory protein [Pararhizobium capsulatum DSM 1112]|uniref:Molybdate transport system regulatory protein n=1 Tax=Pararhizobium capsulatum DSM 1112 TaxID=1121113 RepID=A0ABU0BVL1_9HYPH|nr:LysR family transcriptional regulator [Pararhizobium capsulatum]MDQ0321500.1 molybdate transport system regulatory protein [Pararhizobium capsulatum DSM 1112]